jgi:hypothetical protein
MLCQGLRFESNRGHITLHISHYIMHLFPILSLNHVAAVYCHNTLLTKMVYSTFSKFWQQCSLYCSCAKKISIQISTYHVQPEPLAIEAYGLPFCEGVTDLVTQRLVHHGRIYTRKRKSQRQQPHSQYNDWRCVTYSIVACRPVTRERSQTDRLTRQRINRQQQRNCWKRCFLWPAPRTLLRNGAVNTLLQQ